MSNRIRHFTTSAKPGPAPETPSPPPKKPAPRWMHTVWLVGLLITLVLLFIPTRSSKAPTALHFSDWKTKLDAGEIKSATISQSGAVSGELNNGTKYTSRIPTAIKDDDLAADLARHKVDVKATVASTSFWAVIGGLLPFVALLGIYLFISRRATRQIVGGVMGIGASKAKIYDEERPTTRFADVAGYEGAKREISEVVDFLKNPGRYQAAGAVGPKGVLMVGPPGTGKTLLARAVAGEADVPFLALTGSSFVELFVGVGAARVRDLFAAARKRAPAIIFIDEIDAIGQRRGGQFVSNDEREQTLNQMLAEMDGFDPATSVVVLAATNRPESLDPALLRPGRFDRQVEIPLPNLRERAAILVVHAREKKLGPDVDLERVARGTPGFSGADLANLVNEAAIVAVRADRDTLAASDFDEARDRVLLGRRESTNALDARREARGGGARIRPRAGGRPVGARRSGGEDHDPSRGSGVGRHRATAGRRTASLLRELPQGLARGASRRSRGRVARARRGVDGRGERPRRCDRPRDPHGARIRHEPAARAGRLRERFADVSRRRGGPQSGLRRGHAARHRRRGRRPACARPSAARSSCCRVTGTRSTASSRTCWLTRRSTAARCRPRSPERAARPSPPEAGDRCLRCSTRPATRSALRSRIGTVSVARVAACRCAHGVRGARRDRPDVRASRSRRDTCRESCRSSSCGPAGPAGVRTHPRSSGTRRRARRAHSRCRTCIRSCRSSRRCRPVATRSRSSRRSGGVRACRDRAGSGRVSQ